MTKQRVQRLPQRPKGSRAAWKMQSIRLLAADNVTMKKVAKRNGVTFNRWAVAVLMREVEREEKRHAKV